MEKKIHKLVVGLCRPRAGAERFGLTEALAFSAELDHWMRYAPVVRRIARYLAARDGRGGVTVLDVGGGPAGLASLLRDSRCRIIALDPNLAALRGNQAIKVAGDGCRLPFRDRAIDIVASVDSLEHIPGERRGDFLRELDRVAQGLILIHCPLDSEDGAFQGTRYDRLFQRLHRRGFGAAEANTAEHLRYGLPTVEFIRSVFPSAVLHGLQNGDVWLRHMLGARRRWWKLVNGLYYAWVLRGRDDHPPFHGGLVVVDRAAATARRSTCSVVVLAKNEASRIGRCLSRLRWADEVIVVDGYSQDQTVAIARQWGARVIQRHFSGSFAEERNAGLDAATGEWVLQIDADDVVTPGMEEALARLLFSDDGRFDVYQFRRRSILFDHPLAFGGWTHHLPNLVRRTIRYVGLVHERPDVPPPWGILDGEIDHRFCDRYTEQVGKLNRYSSLSAQQRSETSNAALGSWTLLRGCWFRPVKLFWKVYVKKQGYRDGIYGLIMALHNSWSHVVMTAKWWERSCAEAGYRLSPSLTEHLTVLNEESDRLAHASSARSLPRVTWQLALRMWLAPGLAWFRHLLSPRGLGRGWEGVMLSALAGFQRFVTEVKCWEAGRHTARQRLTSSHGRKPRDVLLITLLAVAGCLLLANLDNGYLWQDEAETALLARHTLQFGYPRATDGRNAIEILTHGYGPGEAWIYSPWLPFYVLAAVFALLGESTWAARLPFALFGWLSVFLAWRLACRLSADRRIQRLTVALLVLSVPFLLHMRQCRYYAMTTALLLATCLAYLTYRRRPSRAQALWVGLILVLLFHTNFGTFVPACATVALHQVGWGSPETRRRLWVPGVVLAALALPWALFFYQPAFVGTVTWDRIMDHAEYYVRVTNKYLIPLAFMGIVSLLAWVIGTFGERVASRSLSGTSVLRAATVSPYSSLGTSEQHSRAPHHLSLGREAAPAARSAAGRLRRRGRWWDQAVPRSDREARGLPRQAGEMASASEPEGGRSGRTRRQTCHRLQRDQFGFLILMVAAQAVFLLIPDQRHLRYWIPTLPLLAIGEAWWLVSWQARHRLAGAIVIVLALFTNALQSTRPRVPLMDFADELTHRYTGPMEGIVAYLREHAQPHQTAKIPYDDRTLMFYTNVTVEPPSRFLAEDEPDWVIVRRDWVPEGFFESESFRRLEASYERIELDAPDLLWQNREDPGSHHFRTVRDAPPVVIYRKRGESHG